MSGGSLESSSSLVLEGSLGAEGLHDPAHHAVATEGRGRCSSSVAAVASLEGGGGVLHMPIFERLMQACTIHCTHTHLHHTHTHTHTCTCTCTCHTPHATRHMHMPHAHAHAHIYICIHIHIHICIHICLQRFVAPSDSERAAAVQLQSRVRGLRGRRISRERSADRLQLSSVTGVYDDCRRPTILARHDGSYYDRRSPTILASRSHSSVSHYSRTRTAAAGHTTTAASARPRPRPRPRGPGARATRAPRQPRPFTPPASASAQ